MSQIIINADIDLDVNQLAEKLNQEFKGYVIQAMSKLQPVFLAECKRLIQEGLVNSSVYKSLLDGQLRKEFGLGEKDGSGVESKRALDEIVEAIQKSIKVEAIPSAGENLGGMKIGLFLEDFSDALGANGAKYISRSKKNGETEIPWLRWLLLEGDLVLLYGLMDQAPKFSRTDSYIMVVVKDGGKLTPWRVPPEFAGSANSNWLTEVATTIAPQLAKVIEIEITKYFS